ncbi:MAG: class II aldolase/adducin family protein [Endomicrobiia bacterium]|nr:class II aldolase/adducin family protein [Endomicrobiia bacterium]
MFEDFIKYGRLLFDQGLNNSHSGNISSRKGESIYITRHGAKLGDLSFSDVVKVNLYDESRDEGASCEIKVHRAVYLANPKISSIAHAHPPHAIVLSLTDEKIKPIDMEGAFYMPEIPVLTKCEITISSNCVADNLPSLLGVFGATVVRGHGAFAVGKDIEEAVMRLSVLESASRIIFLNKLLSGRGA